MTRCILSTAALCTPSQCRLTVYKLPREDRFNALKVLNRRPCITKLCCTFITAPLGYYQARYADTGYFPQVGPLSGTFFDTYALAHSLLDSYE